MELLIVCLVALLASGLTFFSGFGLGTLLLPAFAFFMPLPQAIALTAVVHLLNNLFKLVLVGRHAVWQVVWRFGLPAIVAAFVGAYLLLLLDSPQVLYQYTIQGQLYQVTLLRLVLAVVMAAFALWELLPRLSRVTFDTRLLPLGGLLSGFFGGLSGHQGALRSAFLIRLQLDKQAFIATGVWIAVLVDLTRIPTYAAFFVSHNQPGAMLAAAVLSAFAGAYAGSKLLHKMTVRFVQLVVGVLLLLVSVLLAGGLV